MAPIRKGRFFLKILAVPAILALYIFSAAGTYAQSADDVVARRMKLESDLKVLESQIEAQREIVQGKQNEAASLERDIAIFDAKIKQANLSIKARDLSIRKLSDGIFEKQKKIGQLSDKLERELASLAQIIRKTNQVDGTSVPEIIVGSRSVSEVFSDLDNFGSIEEALNNSYDIIRENKQITEEEKKELEEQKAEEVQLRAVQVLEKQRVEQNKSEKAKVLKETRGLEAEYQKILTARQKDAAAIRSELFVLQGSKAISFEKAYEYALFAQKYTGVRPAFLLGIITEETNLGDNLGSGNWRVDMHPTRDQPLFAKITADLGFNPDTMPVSKRPWYGWGGAMGPAQFIPSTWICFAGYTNTATGKCGPSGGSWAGPWQYNESKDRIGKRTGTNPPNPWEPKDAFFAAALLLMDNGADKGTYQAEFRAAMCYLAGCANASKKSLQFYGDDVMGFAAKYQNQINILQNSR